MGKEERIEKRIEKRIEINILKKRSMIRIKKRSKNKSDLVIGLMEYLTGRYLSKSAKTLLSSYLSVPIEYKYLPALHYRIDKKERPRMGPSKELEELKYIYKDDLDNWRVGKNLMDMYDSFQNNQLSITVELIHEPKEPRKENENEENNR